ncbi:MAG: hypothetical protein V8S08_03765 [Lachnoclostridium sp.]
MDYCSNLIELLLRVKLEAFEPRTQLGIILAALSRTILVTIIIMTFDRYRLTLLTENMPNVTKD